MLALVTERCHRDRQRGHGLGNLIKMKTVAECAYVFFSCRPLLRDSLATTHSSLRPLEWCRKRSGVVSEQLGGFATGVAECMIRIVKELFLYIGVLVPSRNCNRRWTSSPTSTTNDRRGGGVSQDLRTILGPNRRLLTSATRL